MKDQGFKTEMIHRLKIVMLMGLVGIINSAPLLWAESAILHVISPSDSKKSAIEHLRSLIDHQCVVTKSNQGTANHSPDIATPIDESILETNTMYNGQNYIPLSSNQDFGLILSESGTDGFSINVVKDVEIESIFGMKKVKKVHQIKTVTFDDFRSDIIHEELYKDGRSGISFAIDCKG